MVTFALGSGTSRNSCPVTSTISRSGAGCSFRSRTTVAAIPKPTTIASGISVQTISSTVWPWIGLPSDMSPGLARNFHIE